jgi:hypothetical protein
MYRTLSKTIKHIPVLRMVHYAAYEKDAGGLVRSSKAGQRYDFRSSGPAMRTLGKK